MPNIKTDYGALGNGQRVADTVTSALGSTHVTFGSSHFVSPGDVGKMIVIGTQGGTNIADTIAAVDGGGAGISLTSNATVAFSGTSKQIEWGTDDRAAFVNFNAAYQGQTGVNLVIPAGRYTIGALGVSSPGIGFGIPGLTLTGDVGNGTILSDMLGNAAGCFLGTCSTGQYQDDAHSARTATVSAGATQITLLTPSQASLFSVNSYALMTGLDMQGYGAPTNQRFFEYVFITNISGGTLTLQSPLKNSYKSTWPLFNAGNAFNPDCGGPATLYALEPSWDGVHEYVDINLDQYLQTNSVGKQITFTRGSSTGFGIYPSRNLLWTANNVDMSAGASAEIDKLNDHVVINGGTWHGITCQSASVNLLELTNVTIGNINGTAGIKTVITGCTVGIGIHLGPIAFGVIDEVVLDSSSFADIAVPGGVSESVPVTVAGSTLITPASNGPFQSINPGKWCFLNGTRADEFAFQVLDVSTDGTNVYATTNLPGGVPPAKLDVAAPGVQSMAVAKFTAINCTDSGAVPLLPYIGGKPGTPFLSCWLRTYTGNIGTQSGIPIIGKLVNAKFTVNTPYNGANSPLLDLDGPFVIGSGSGAGNLLIWNPVINLKQAGTRVITLAGVTGAQPGDTGLAVPDSAWTWLLWNQIDKVHVNADMSDQSGAPVSVTIEINTDQGIGIGNPPIRTHGGSHRFKMGEA